MSDGEITALAPEGDGSPICRELTVIDATPINTVPFELPEGWTVKRLPRSDGIRADKYWFEPGTGKRFSTLRAVEKYLTGGNSISAKKRAKCTPSPIAQEQDSSFEKHYKRRVRRKVLPLIADEKYFPGSIHKSSPRTLKKCSKSSPRTLKKSSKSSSKAMKKNTDARIPRGTKSIISGGKLVRLDDEQLAGSPYFEASASPFDLPDGWVVEEVPRRNTTKYKSYTDKIYYEPGTGKRFLSLVSVKRHLAETEETEEDKPLALMFNVPSPSKKLDPRKDDSEKKEKSPTFGPATPPDKIKWVLTDDNEGSTFKPFIEESMVAESVVQRWANRFMISINGDNNCTTPSFS